MKPSMPSAPSKMTVTSSHAERRPPSAILKLASISARSTRRSSVGETKCAVYARVSTANGQQDPEMQTRELREFAERRGWAIVDVYTDAGISGSKDSRPALNRLMNDARQRRFDVDVGW